MSQLVFARDSAITRDLSCPDTYFVLVFGPMDLIFDLSSKMKWCSISKGNTDSNCVCTLLWNGFNVWMNAIYHLTNPILHCLGHYGYFIISLVLLVFLFWFRVILMSWCSSFPCWHQLLWFFSHSQVELYLNILCGFWSFFIDWWRKWLTITCSCHRNISSLVSLIDPTIILFLIIKHRSHVGILQFSLI